MNILVTGTSGLDLLVRPIEKAFADLEPRVTAGAYGQWQPTLLEAPEGSAAPAMVLVVLDSDDLASAFLDVGLGRVAGVASGFVDEVMHTLERGLQLRAEATFIVTTLAPPRGSMLGPLADNLAPGLDDLVEQVNRALRGWATSRSRVLLLGLHRHLYEHGRELMRDPRMWAHARCRWSRQGLALIARESRALWDASHGSPRKCLVLDLDNTLWGGVLGEEGPQGIQLGEEGLGLAFRDFQACIRRLRSRGVLLAIVSKNDEDATWEVIEKHPYMVLRRDDFVAWRINWNDKARNLAEVAAELNLGLESLVFVDDSPAERLRVEQAMPEIEVPGWPSEATSLADFAEDVIGRLFDRVSLLHDDALKTDQYHAQRRREEVRAGAQHLHEFLESLEMTACYVEPSRLVLARFAQLTQKTNQFNATTRRYDLAELEARVADPGHWITLGVRLGDRFGDSGIVGLAIAERLTEATWTMDTFLLSCRAIGRTLETVLLDGTIERIRARGGKELRALYLPTRRNSVVSGLWRDLAFECVHDAEDRTEWRVDLSAADVRYASGYIQIETEGCS